MAEAEVLLSGQTGSETAKVAVAHRALELLQVRQTSVCACQKQALRVNWAGLVCGLLLAATSSRSAAKAFLHPSAARSQGCIIQTVVGIAHSPAGFMMFTLG